MIQKLRRSFVAVTMLSAALVLAILMGAVNLLNYIQRTEGDREILAFLAENGGSFPNAGRMDRGWHGDGTPRHMTAETPYETRFFSVLLAEDGSLVYVDTTRVAAVERETAIAMAQTVQSGGRPEGVYGSYRFTSVDYDGTALYIFLDCTRNQTASQDFFLNSLAVTAAGLVVLLGISWILSPRAVRPIAESYEKQKSFITNAGHELKTPLAVIESCTDVIELESGESQWTDSIRQQVDRLASLTQELVALARMDEADSSLTLEDADISEIVSDALRPYAAMAEQRGLGFAADIQPGIRLRSNREALRKICGILADNAVKYTSPGGQITFALEKTGGHVFLRASNPAEGLSPGSQELLFDRFYRADTSRSSETPGYGLGLPLARSLAESLGGKIHAHSPDGTALEITMRLG